MNIKYLCINLLSALIFALMVNSSQLFAEELESVFVEGDDYSLVNKPENTHVAQLSELESISHIEVFYWYGCEPCYQVDAAIDDYLEQNPNYLIRRTPLVLRPSWREQAYIQPLMAQLLEQENLPNIIQIYQQCLLDCQLFSDYPSIVNWFSEKLEAELPLIDEEKIWQAEKNYRKRADLFSISQVPTIIINETYKVDANQAQTAKRLVEIIDFLLSK